MDKERDELRDIFAAYDPELPSGRLFMSGLERRMEAVEIVKERSAATRRRNRMAVAVAAAVGMIVGIALCLLYPLVADRMHWLSTSFGSGAVRLDLGLLIWAAIAGVSGVIAYNTYEALMSAAPVRNR